MENIQGARYRCQDCDNFDLCQNCYQGEEHGHQHHGFLRYDRPDMSPLFLPPQHAPPTRPAVQPAKPVVMGGSMKRLGRLAKNMADRLADSLADKAADEAVDGLTQSLDALSGTFQEGDVMQQQEGYGAVDFSEVGGGFDFTEGLGYTGFEEFGF
jgi:hypothetical protein